MKNAVFDAEIAEGPANSSAYWLNTEDGVRLRIGLWKPDTAALGSVLVFPGRGECVEKYGRNAAEFGKYGYATLVIDWRGQGLSDRLTGDRMVGHVLRFSDYHKDVAAMLKAAEDLELPKPWHLFGHSMGTCIGLRALINGLPVASCGFTAPMWGIKMTAFQRLIALPLSWATQALGKGHVYVPGDKGQERKSYVLSVDFQDNRLTSSADMYDYMVNLATELPDRQTAAPSMGWLYQALRECKALSSMPSPNIPCLVFCGDKDELVDISAVQDRMSRWDEGQFKMIRDAKHDVLSELPEIREPAIASFCRLFLKAEGADLPRDFSTRWD